MATIVSSKSYWIIRHEDQYVSNPHYTGKRSRFSHVNTAHAATKYITPEAARSVASKLCLGTEGESFSIEELEEITIEIAYPVEVARKG